MAISVKDVKAWSETLDPKGSIAIDDSGLSLVELTKDGEETGVYLEIGGVPEKSAPTSMKASASPNC
jgi:hypothetical protein